MGICLRRSIPSFFVHSVKYYQITVQVPIHEVLLTNKISIFAYHCGNNSLSMAKYYSITAQF